MTTPEHVIFRHFPGNALKWHYYSMPTSTVGGGATRAEARASYRSALAFALEVAEDDLPSVIEHTEREIEPDVWVRFQNGPDQMHRDEAFEKLAELGRQFPGCFDELLDTSTTASGDVVLVACLPTDTVKSVHDQMTDYDTVVVTTPYVDHESRRSGIWWVPVSGELSEGREVEGAESLSENGLSDASTVDELRAVVTQGMRVLV